MLIDHLPSNSAFVEAIASDEETAARWLQENPDPEEARASEPHRPRFSEWSPERAELVKILDAVRTVAAAVLASGGGKPGRLTPEPRPQSAVERLRALRATQERIAERQDIFSQLWPDGVPDAPAAPAPAGPPAGADTT